jgi:hypothetical protein
VRYAAAYSQQQLERLTTGRPANSPGWGMVQCVKTGELKSRNGREVCRVTAGTTRCAVGYWAVVQWPEFFKPVDTRDKRTIDQHRGNLERTRRELERGRTTTSSTRTSLVLPSRPAGREPWRLPRPAAARPLRLPR